MNFSTTVVQPNDQKVYDQRDQAELTIKEIKALEVAKLPFDFQISDNYDHSLIHFNGTSWGIFSGGRLVYNVNQFGDKISHVYERKYAAEGTLRFLIDKTTNSAP